MRRYAASLTLALAFLAPLGAEGCRKAAKPPSTQPSETRAVAESTQPPIEQAPIEIRLPTPMFKGTPKPVSEPNIEKPSGKLRPPFLAPEGVTNLAAGKPVTSSDPEPIIGELSMVTDGEKDGQDGYFVELGFGTQWVQIDLEQPATIYAIVIWHYHAQARAYRDVIVQVSDDPEFASSVTTVFNSDHDNSSNLGAGTDMGYVETFEGKLIDCRGAEGRYVRLYSRGNTSNDENHYIEVEVYGKPNP